MVGFGEGTARPAQSAEETAPDAGVTKQVPVTDAWQEMVAPLDIRNRQSRTTGAFARAAIQAGLPEDAVREVTAMYREIQYGHGEPTVERQRRAWQALADIRAARETEVAGQ
jgi:hypothetical protein